MKGYLYQLYDKDYNDAVFGIYWSEKEIPEYLLKEAFNNWESSDLYDDLEFEEFWNLGTSEIKIERVFLEKIYI